MRMSTPLVVVGTLVALSLGPVTGQTAQAAPYPGTVETLTTVDSLGPVGPDERPRLRVEVATQGNAEPRGPLRISFVRRDGEVRRLYDRRYPGRPVVLSFPPLRKVGKYVVTVTFRSRASSVYAPSATSTRQLVEQG